MYIPSRDKKLLDDLTDGPEEPGSSTAKRKKRKNRILETREERDARIAADGHDPNPKKKSPQWKHKYGEVRGWKRKKKGGRKKIFGKHLQTWEGHVGGIGVDERVRVKPPSPRHMEVLDEYYRNGRDKRLAILECGYAESTACNVGIIFNREDVRREMRRRDRYLARKYDVSEDRIVKELASLAFTGMGDFIKIDPETSKATLDMSKATEEQLAAITKFKMTPAGIQFDLSDKMSALDKLARIEGMYDDKVTVLGHEDAVARLQAGRARMNKQRETQVEDEEDEDD